jgi:outer membrane murein-binding lipoprotein Lpp
MKTAFTLLLLLILCPAMFAQAVSADKIKIQAKKVTWKAGTPYSDSQMMQGREVKSISANGLSVAIITDDSLGYHAVLVVVDNKYGKRVTVDPNNFQMYTLKPKEQILSPLEPEKVAHSIEKQARWKNILGAFLAGMATRRSVGTIRDSQTGDSAEITITSPDYAAQRSAINAARERNARNQERATTIRDISLLANTIPDGESITGWVFFDKKSSTQSGIIINVDDITFVFPDNK